MDDRPTSNSHSAKPFSAPSGTWMFLMDFSDPTQKWLPHNFSKKEGEDSQTLFLLEKKLIKFFQEHFLQISSSSFFAKTVKVTVFQEEEKESFFSFLSERKLLKTNNRLNLPFFSLSKFFSPFLSRSGGSSTLVNVGTIFWLQRWPQILVFWKLRILMIEEKASKERQYASTVWFKSFFSRPHLMFPPKNKKWWLP